MYLHEKVTQSVKLSQHCMFEGEYHTFPFLTCCCCCVVVVFVVVVVVVAILFIFDRCWLLSLLDLKDHTYAFGPGLDFVGR